MSTETYRLFIATLMLISTLTSEGQSTNRPPAWVGIPIGSTKEGTSQELMTEYSTIVSKYNTTTEEWWKDFEKNISTADRARLEQIFKQMSSEQHVKQKVAFIQPPQPLKKVVPSEKEFDSWKNADVYGIWIDGKKADNAILNKYKNADFDQVTVSKLYGAAKQNKRYAYQVNLMTKEYYRAYYEQTVAKKGSIMTFGG